MQCCCYFLIIGGQKKSIGRAVLPHYLDVDDNFVRFFKDTYSEYEKASVEQYVANGGLLVAEHNGIRTYLAYCLKDESNMWFGREATLRYFDVDVRLDS